MAKRSSKGPRRPKVRIAVGVAPRVMRPAMPPVQHHVVTHIHRAGPPVGGGLAAPGGLVAPRPIPGVNTAFPRPAVGPGVGAGPFTVPQPAVGAPRAPLLGPGGGPIPPFGRRF